MTTNRTEPTEPLAYCAYDIEKDLEGAPERSATLDELCARHPKYSRGLMRKAVKMLMTIGRVRVRTRYENRRGGQRHEFSPASAARV